MKPIERQILKNQIQIMKGKLPKGYNLPGSEDFRNRIKESEDLLLVKEIEEEPCCEMPPREMGKSEFVLKIAEQLRLDKNNKVFAKSKDEVKKE